MSVVPTEEYPISSEGDPSYDALSSRQGVASRERLPHWLVAASRESAPRAAFVILAASYLAFVALRLTPALNVWLVMAIVVGCAFPMSGIGLTAITLIPPELQLVPNLPTGLFLLIAAAVGQLARVSVQGRPVSVGWPTAAAVGFGLITLANLLWVLARGVSAPRAVPDWAILITGIIACLLVASEPRAARRAPIFVFGIGGAISVIAAIAVALPGLFQDGPLFWLVKQGFVGRALGSTHGANVLGIVAAMSFVYFTVRAAGRESPRDVAVWLLMAGACIPALYFTFSRSAALGVGVAVVLGLHLLGRRGAVLAAIALVAGAIVMGPILIASRLDTSSGRVGGSTDPQVAEAQANSDRLRIEAWAAGLRMAIDQPISGVGFGRYAVLSQGYGGPKELGTPHSDYIRFFSETGVPGGTAFLLFIGGVAWSLRGAREPHRAGLAAAIAAFCVATQFNAQLYYLESSLPFWVAAGAAIQLHSARPQRSLADRYETRDPAPRGAATIVPDDEHPPDHPPVGPLNRVVMIRLNRLSSPIERFLPELLGAGMFSLPLIVVAALPDPWALPKTVVMLAITVGLVGALGVVAAVPRIFRRSGVSGTTKALGVYLALTALATILSSNPFQSVVGEEAQYQGFLATLGFAIAYAAASHSITAPDRIRYILGAAVGAGFLVGLYGILQQAGYDPISSLRANGRIFSTLGQPNALAAYLVLALPLALALVAAGRKTHRVVATIAATTIAVALALTLSRGGYLGAVVALLVFVGFAVSRSSLTRQRLGLVAAAVTVVALVAVVSPITDTVGRIITRAGATGDVAETSAAQHLALWRVGVQIVVDNPVLGIGPEMYPEFFPRYRDRLLSPAQAAGFAPYRVESPHNVPLAIADGAGIPALVAYLLIVVSALRSGFRRLSTSSPEERILIAGLLGAVAGHVVTDLFMTADVTGSWIFWALLGTLTATGIQRSKSEGLGDGAVIATP